MARKDLQELYHKLVITEFQCVCPGERELQEIYNTVRRVYAPLCDDGYLCSENCSNGHYTPEWQHAVRRALDRFKRLPSRVRLGSRRGQWNFT